jgi:hypothetical protein
MIRRLKTLGLCLPAVLALSAVVAGSASAQFESEGTATTVTRSVNNVQSFQYQAEGMKVECKIVEGTGTIKGTATTEFEWAPEYKECSTVLGPADVEFNGCSYLFTAAEGSTSVTQHLLCPAGSRQQSQTGPVTASARSMSVPRHRVGRLPAATSGPGPHGKSKCRWPRLE